MQTVPPPSEETRPFVLPCRTLAPDAPWRWLRLGWRDFTRAPGLSLLFGTVIALISLAVCWLGWQLGRFALLAALLSGFVFIAPLLAVGLYCVSRGFEQGRIPTLRDSFRLACRVAGQAGVFALGQMVILLLWSRAGMMVSVFVPMNAHDAGGLVRYLLIGSIVGSVFAAFTFATAVFSLPTMADREVDMVTACVSSVNAVLLNKAVMLRWALLLALLTGLALATVGLGLVVVMPWLAYAAWHGYREAIDASSWPALD